MKTHWPLRARFRNEVTVEEIREVERLISSGGVVHRSESEDTQIVLCHRKNPNIWCLPKGTPDFGETLEDTAMREVLEETGLSVIIDSPLGTIEYSFSNRHDKSFFRKTVYFFLMHPVGGSLADHDCEFDDVFWLPIERAIQLMTYPNEIGVVEKAVIQLQSGLGS